MSGKDPFLLHLQMLEDNIYGMRLNLEVLITTFKLTNLRALKPMDNLCAEMLLDIMESLLPTMYGWEPRRDNQVLTETVEGIKFGTSECFFNRNLLKNGQPSWTWLT
jgi:hypothetical protein